MWLIRKINDAPGTIRYLISEKKCLTIGRQNSDMNLLDSSISRTHCVFNIAAKKECPFTVPTSCGVWIVDKKSKYGTFIHKNHEWMKIEPEKVQELSNGSVIRFGLMDNIWRLEYTPLIACASKLSKEQIQELKLLLPSVDGKLVNKWVKQCTIVFVNDLTVTVKVLLALINGVPIVTINFLRQLVNNVKQNLAWPDYKLFKPEIAEPTLIPHLVSLNTEDHRKELFRGKTFVIPTEEQLENLKEIILAAGGQVELLKLHGNWRYLIKENVIFIQLPCTQLINPDKITNSFKSLANVLKHEYHMRVVPETEIFQAIAYSSTEKYCNPKSLAFEIRQSLSNQNSCGDIIEEATPSQNTQRRTEENMSRNIENMNKSNSSSKMHGKDITPRRKRNHSPELEASNKRITLNKGQISCASSMQLDDDLHNFLNGSNNREQYEPSKQTDTSEIIQVSKSSIGNNERQKSISTLDNDPKNFFNTFLMLEKNDTKCRKRKILENSNDESDFDQQEKRKRSLEDINSRRILTNEKYLNSKASSPNVVTRQNSFQEASKNMKLPEFIDNSDGKWIRRKNAPSRAYGSENICDELQWLNKNSKKFKKKETFSYESVPNCTGENLEDIGEKLLMEGWHRSRCSRMRTTAPS